MRISKSFAFALAFVSVNRDGSAVAAYSSLSSTRDAPSSIVRRDALLRIAGSGGGVLLSTATTSSAAAASSEGESLMSRFATDDLVEPRPNARSELGGGVGNLYYPSWLAGEWDVSQTLADARAPLGVVFLGGPDASSKIGEATMEETRSRVGAPVRLRLRYVRTKWGVAEDRLFNARQRLDAFAGRAVVASVDYADVGGSNRASVLALGGSEDDPLQTTLTRFKGPAAQKTFVVAYGASDLSADEWAGYELDRAIFALTNQSTAPPVTTDTELLWQFKRINEDEVAAKLRIAEYLNAQSDKLYFDAKRRAVSLLDYDLRLKRVANSG